MIRSVVVLILHEVSIIIQANVPYMESVQTKGKMTERDVSFSQNVLFFSNLLCSIKF